MMSGSYASQHSNTADSSFGNRKYDVFLSFRGPDTRQGFVSQLYSSLEGAGVSTFPDTKCLPRGEHSASSLLQAIRASKICIPVFSQNFAVSQSCLEQVLHMLKSKTTICPIFYDVLPTDVRNPDRGTFAEDFEKHSRTLNAELIREYKKALTDASNLSGWSLDQYKGKSRETDLINEVVNYVINNLPEVYLYTPKCFGIEWPVDHVKRLLKLGDHQRKIVKVGIHGMPGIGKTTLAKVVYKHICSQFEASCFVLNVRERSEEVNGLAKLQEQVLTRLLRDRRVVNDVDQGRYLIEKHLVGTKILLVLDDIETDVQLEALAGNFRDFGADSRLLITSRNLQILNVAKVDEVYEISKLQHNHALQLFTSYAFPNSSSPDEDANSFCNKVVSACEGLPFALEVVGKSLIDERDKNVWKDMVDKVKCRSNIQEKLKTCYDSLTDFYEREMFQDIACFFAWMDTETVILFWKKLNWSPYASLKHLLQRSIISYGPRNELIMHSCLRDLGKTLAREVSTDPHKCTRLFDIHDVKQVFLLSREKAAKVLYLSYEPKKQKSLNVERFNSLSNLKLLWLADVVIEGQFSVADFRDLRWLRWTRCSSKCLPSHMNLKRLIILQVTDSQITNLWDESSEALSSIQPRKIEVLILSGCGSLEKLPASLIYTRLQILDLKNCKSLRSLPNSMVSFKSLESLNMEGCGVSNLPDDFGELSNLRILKLSGCKHLCKLPDSFGKLIRLEELQLHHNPKLMELPQSFGELKALLCLNAGHCQLSDNGLPLGISGLCSLKIMHLEHNKFRSLPSSFKNLTRVSELYLDGCKELSTLAELPQNLELLHVPDCIALYKLCKLRDLKSLIILDVRKSVVTKLPEVESLQNLTTLNLLGCNHISTETIERCLGGLHSLDSLVLGGPGVLSVKLQSIYKSIMAISFDDRCLLRSSDIKTFNWRVTEVGGKKGEVKSCMEETFGDKVMFSAGYVVCSLAHGQVFPSNEDRETGPSDVGTELKPTSRLWYTIERKEEDCPPCKMLHPELNGDGDVLEVRFVRVDGNSNLAWLRMGSKLKVKASSDYDNWEACFKFLLYEPHLDLTSFVALARPPLRITFHP